MSASASLFSPLRAGDLLLPNRIIMAPLTRCRADAQRVPTPLMAKYYAQRASAGLIISEATSISPQGVGYSDSPGIWSAAQVQGWQSVTDAVHAAGGRIVMQLWHVGRISDPQHLNGDLPVSASAIAAKGHVSLLRPLRSYVVPRALASDELPGLIASYRLAAVHAKTAGFDGVELHGANGYLIDQFLQDKTNRRNDLYGGSIENRARLLLEVTDALIAVFGAGRVGVHIAPKCDAHDMGDSNPVATFSYVARELGKRNIAFIFARESLAEPYLGTRLKQEFGGVYIANQGMTKKTAEHLLASGAADAIGFGTSFIANPDLPTRLLHNAVFNPAHSDTFYGPALTDKALGYTDYPSLPQ